MQMTQNNSNFFLIFFSNFTHRKSLAVTLKTSQPHLISISKSVSVYIKCDNAKFCPFTPYLRNWRKVTAIFPSLSDGLEKCHFGLLCLRFSNLGKKMNESDKLATHYHLSQSRLEVKCETEPARQKSRTKSHRRLRSDRKPFPTT